MQTDRCDSVNTGVQLIAFCQSCFSLTMKMWIGIDHEEFLKDPKQNSRIKVHRFRVSEERVLLNIWTYPDRWMLLDKPFNSQVSEKVSWVPQLTRTWRVNNFLMIKKKSPHRLYIKIINIIFFLIQRQQEHQTDLFICKCDPVERIVYHWFRHDLIFFIITINILKIDNRGFGLYLSFTGG